MDKPLILIINDDGIDAPGLRTLIEEVRDMGYIVVVAPDSPRSGTGHSVTVREPLRFQQIARDTTYEEYSCNGTPVDCVKIAGSVILKRKPDLILSGINHGSNASINVLYSGTMGAAIEGALVNIPAIGFSLLNYSRDADFSSCGKYVRAITTSVLKNGMPPHVCLNVNIPAVNGSEIKGIRLCRQAKGIWREMFEEEIDPGNNSYFWLKGEFELTENRQDTDIWALKNNYVSVVPVQIDMTAYDAILALKKLELDA